MGSRVLILVPSDVIGAEKILQNIRATKHECTTTISFQVQYANPDFVLSYTKIQLMIGIYDPSINIPFLFQAILSIVLLAAAKRSKEQDALTNVKQGGTDIIGAMLAAIGIIVHELVAHPGFRVPIKIVVQNL